MGEEEAQVYDDGSSVQMFDDMPSLLEADLDVFLAKGSESAGGHSLCLIFGKLAASLGQARGSI